tara:strand:- start:452 stop:871 length:420 start_codon:yes stop_codon:yes gene_type:complete
MATLKTNTLTGTSTAGSIAVTGEGNSTTTNLQQGLVKAWINLGTSSATNRDSFNHSSITDNGTGDFSPVMTNAMANINYAQAAAMSRQTNADTDSINTNNSTGNDVDPTTTTYRFGALQFGTGGVDVKYVNFQIAGDLA